MQHTKHAPTKKSKLCLNLDLEFNRRILDIIDVMQAIENRRTYEREELDHKRNTSWKQRNKWSFFDNFGL